MRHLCDAPVQRWRNGGGVTCELLAVPRGEDWRWRVSLAEIARDGPFSPFPGVDRWFAVVEGAGVELDFHGAGTRCLRNHQPLHFDGGAVPYCRLLAGPTRDLNLMLRRGAKGAMHRAHAGELWRPATTQAGLYTTAAVRVHTDGGAECEVPVETLLWFDVAPATLRYDGPRDAPAWWLEVDDTAEPRR
jgi:environmental stress-induced protein Ves